MSEYTVRLPDVGEGVAEAEIVEWHVAVGDTIDEDDALVDVMSDKATIELPSPVAGTVRWIAGDVGDVIAVGSTLVQIDVDDGAAAGSNGVAAPSTADDRRADAAPSRPTGSTSDVAEPPAAAPAAARGPSRGRRPAAAPAVRARARDIGVELGVVDGTGPDGRITHSDLDAYLMSMTPSGFGTVDRLNR